MGKADRRGKTGRTDMGSSEQGKEKKKRSKQRNRNEEWKYFRGLLGGVEGRVLLGEVRMERMADKRGIEKEEININT